MIDALKRIAPPAVKQLVKQVLGVQAESLRWTYHKDGLATEHNCDFIRDPAFARAYQKGKDTGSWAAVEIEWRAHVIAWAAHQARHLPGDFVECGVNKGGLASVALEYAQLRQTDKRMYLFDTYEGLKADLISDAERAIGIAAGGYESCYEQVLQTFRPWGDQVRVVKGAVPDTLGEFRGERVSFLSIDMNCVAPEIAAIEFFYPRLSPGALIVLDDYGWLQHIHQKHAMDAFFRDKPEQVLSLPTGQGLVVKL